MVLYELMTLERPFAGKDHFALTEMTLQGLSPTLSEELSRKYSRIVPIWRSCVKKEANARTSVSELKKRLMEILE